MDENKSRDILKQRIADGSIAEQKAWKFIKELNDNEENAQSIALINGDRSYTFRQMFSEWRRYAEAFSGLSVTGKNESRVGFICFPTAESVFAFYALNMTGASVYPIAFFDLYNITALSNYIKANKITDLVASDVILPENLRELMKKKEELGLKNIVLIHSKAAGPINNPFTAFLSEANLFMLRKINGVRFMDDLLVEYEGYPITLGAYRKNYPSLVMQTSGTTKGAHKPIPHSDLSFNSGALYFLQEPEVISTGKNAVALNSIIGYEAAYATEDMLHMPLARGMAVVMNYGFGTTPENLMMLIMEYKVSFVLINGMLLDRWMMSPESAKLRLDTVDYIALGGGYLSAEKRKIYNRFLKEHGCKTNLINGYGMTEFCGACIFSPPEQEDDSIGYALPGVKVRILDENDGKFYTPEDGVRTGEMYISASSMALEKLDGKTWSERIKIDGETYLRTNDVAFVQEDGSLAYAGRSNRFFVDNENIRFDAGRVETSVSAQPGIHDCALIPRNNKCIHDTIPVLCVKTSCQPAESPAVLQQALRQVFINENLFKDSNLPSFCVIMEDIPYNSNGKVDIYRLTRGDIKGQAFLTKAIRVEGNPVDILLLPVPEQNDYAFISMPEEIEEDYKNSVFNPISENNQVTQMLDQIKEYGDWFKKMPKFPFSPNR